MANQMANLRDHSAEPSAEDRLGSWKEIAAYLKCSERTVRRWEEEGLPVHRHTHKSKAAIYAYKTEIDTWWRNGHEHLRPVEVVKPAKNYKVLPWLIALVGAIALAGIARWILVGRPVFSFHERDSVLISDFENHTGDARFDDALLTAFTISLEQSRYANVVPRARVEAALKHMGRSPKERVFGEVAREICQRENIRGLVAADITRTGQQFALSARLEDPLSGVTVRSYSERVYGEDHVLDALDRIAARIRADLGESLYQIHRADKALPQVTTSSLAALKQYADGRSLWHGGKYKEAISLFVSAIALDADFAMAHAALGNALCSNMADYQRERCDAEFLKALSLSSRVTDRERRIIELRYNNSLGYTDTADRLFRLYLGDYPDDWNERWGYARLLRMHGRPAEAIQQYREVLRLDPNDGGPYIDIATCYKILDKPAEALAAYAEAFRLDPAWLNISNINREYGFALVANGQEAQAEQVFAAFASDPARRPSGLDSLALLDLMHGRYAKAYKRLEEAMSLAEQQREPFLIARNRFLLAAQASGVGNKKRQLKELDAALSDFSNLGPKVEYGSLVGQEYARAGAIEKAEEIAARIAPLADKNSDEQSGYLSLLQGEIALAKGDAGDAARLFDLQDPRYGTNSIVLISTEALARAFHKAGKSEDAISWYERTLQPGKAGSCALSTWAEVQQRCAEARLALASEYFGRGDKQKAGRALAPLLKDWQDADADLPLRKQALELASRISQ